MWTVRADGSGLDRRVDGAAEALASEAMGPTDQASSQLGEAWAAAYGRQSDPSDAWDHAIKALEAVLIPIVVPRKEKATLGDVLGQLKANPDRFTFVLGTSSATVGAVGTVEALLRMVWPNPDRHGGGPDERVPSLAEAQTVVQIAVFLVQAARQGALAAS